MGKNQKKKFNGIKCPLGDADGALSQAVAKEEAANKKVESWLDDLSPEDREAEEEKQKKREAQAKKEEEKAKIARAQREESEKKMDRKTRHWNIEKKKFLTPGNGVVLAENYEDKWYVQEDDDWIEVNDIYYCKLCDKHLNDFTLEAHVLSKPHTNKVLWTGARPAGARSSVTGTVSEEYNEPWFEFINDEWGGYSQCRACDKRADEVHIQSAGHISRVESWRENQQQKIQPIEEWLIYLFWSADSKMEHEMGLKCLVCDKFCQDLLSHGSDLERASKEHKRRMGNYAYYEDVVRQSRRKLIEADSTGILHQICERQTSPLRGPDTHTVPHARSSGSNAAPSVRTGKPTIARGADELGRANASVFHAPLFQGRPAPSLPRQSDPEKIQGNGRRAHTRWPLTSRLYEVVTAYDGIEDLDGQLEAGYLELILHETVTLNLNCFEDGQKHNHFSKYAFFTDRLGREGWAPLACLRELD
eukprot:GEMP01014562.1.p1 GENE.GEMP01014562.1~~GEMP01014562.1.p1  ORF type:complete len:475 (+),score=89.72 GEMP01014562.1:97-1521(+)